MNSSFRRKATMNLEKSFKLNERNYKKSVSDLNCVKYIDNSLPKHHHMLVELDEIKGEEKSNTNLLRFQNIRKTDVGSNIRPHNYFWNAEELHKNEITLRIAYLEELKQQKEDNNQMKSKIIKRINEDLKNRKI